MRRNSQDEHNRLTGILLLILLAMFISLATQVCGQEVRLCRDTSYWCEVMGWCEDKCTRVSQFEQRYYKVPKTVGVNSQIRDTGQGNAPWWGIGDDWPLRQSLAFITSKYDISAVGVFLRSHPWDDTQNFENIREAIRYPEVQILQLSPQWWGSQGNHCNGDGTTSLGGITWLGYPTAESEERWAHIIQEYGIEEPRASEIMGRHQRLYAGLYQYYAGQPKHIIISSPEAGWQVYGAGCRGRDVGYLPPNGRCMPACEDGTLVWDDVTPADATCQQACLDIDRLARADYLRHLWGVRQADAEAARASNPGAVLKVWHSVEVNLFKTESWQFIVPLCDIIPKMHSPPDFIGLSLYSAAGDPVEALEYAMECTGLPAYRFYVSEVGRKVSKGDQYEVIYSTIDRLFEAGVAFALVWSLDLEGLSYEPNAPYSVIDPVTQEPRPGMQAIWDLNEKWGE